MSGLLALDEPALGAIAAFGALLALLAWLLVRDAGPRARAVVAALGGVLLFLAVSRAFGGAAGQVARGATFGRGGDTLEHLIDLALVLVGLAAGAGAVLAAHGGVAVAGEELAEDDDDDDDDDARLARVQVATVSLTPWVDLLALAVALALPIGIGGSFGVPDDGNGVTVTSATYHLLAGFLLAGALLVAVARDDLRERGPAVVAFGLVAASQLLLPFVTGAVNNEYWVPFARGVAAGLVAVVAVPLVVRGLRRDRTAAIAGALTAFVLLVLNAYFGSWALWSLQGQQVG